MTRPKQAHYGLAFVIMPTKANRRSVVDGNARLLEFLQKDPVMARVISPQLIRKAAYRAGQRTRLKRSRESGGDASGQDYG